MQLTHCAARRNLLGAGIDLQGEFPNAARVWDNLQQNAAIAQGFQENGGSVQRKPGDELRRPAGSKKAKASRL